MSWHWRWGVLQLYQCEKPVAGRVRVLWVIWFVWNRACLPNVDFLSEISKQYVVVDFLKCTLWTVEFLNGVLLEAQPTIEGYLIDAKGIYVGLALNPLCSLVYSAVFLWTVSGMCYISCEWEFRNTRMIILMCGDVKVLSELIPALRADFWFLFSFWIPSTLCSFLRFIPNTEKETHNIQILQLRILVF